MERSARIRASTLAGSIFAIFVLTFFILRASLDLMNQRSDLKLLLGVGGIASIIFLWGFVITKLFKLMEGKKCRDTKVEKTKVEE